MTKKQVFYIAFFSALVLGFFAFLSYRLPEFTKPKTVVIGEVQPFEFINQDGRPVNQKAVEGKVLAVNFFFTTCRSVCPRMNNNLAAVYEKYRNEPDLLLLSHTSDPERDSASVLKQYTDSMKIDTKKWIFLTGRKDSLYKAARHSYHIDDPANYVNNPQDDFLHTQFIALVNRKGQVVKIYDGLKPSEMRELANDIPRYLKEK
jgi:protein SCO1/2